MLGLVLLMALGGSEATAQELEQMFGKDAVTALHANGDATAVLIDETAKSKTKLEGYPVISKPVAVSDALRAQIARLVLTQKAPDSSAGKLLQWTKLCGGFQPRVALQLPAAPGKWTLLLCFKCNEAFLHQDGKVRAHVDLELEGKALVKIFSQNLFPGDAPLAGLANSPDPH